MKNVKNLYIIDNILSQHIIGSAPTYKQPSDLWQTELAYEAVIKSLQKVCRKFKFISSMEMGSTKDLYIVTRKHEKNEHRKLLEQTVLKMIGKKHNWFIQISRNGSLNLEKEEWLGRGAALHSCHSDICCVSSSVSSLDIKLLAIIAVLRYCHRINGKKLCILTNSRSSTSAI